MVRETDEHHHHHHQAVEEEMKVLLPAWLHGLLMKEAFFSACEFHNHINFRKNEKNIFCLKCCRSFCNHCLPSHHTSHPLLQVRRYVYQNVIRLDDLEKIIDCSFIQPYTINGAKVIFLNSRPQSKSCKQQQQLGSGNSCFSCDRILQDPFNFCSLSCKVNHAVYQGEDLLSSILYRRFEFDESDFAISQFEGLRVDGQSTTTTSNSILENSNAIPIPIPIPIDEYGSSNYDAETEGSSVNFELVKKRNSKKNGRFLPAAGIMLSLSNRRKGSPHRSPLC